MKLIPYSRQFINSRDISAVNKVLKSDYLTTGPTVKKFEELISNYCNVKYTSCVNSASSALLLACKALELKKGDYVWTSPITFVSSINCALHCGSKIDFVDINFSNFNICTSSLEKKLINASKTNRLPKILIVVHLGGVSSDMKKIDILSKKYKFKIIEDSSHAFGSTYKNSKVGSCKYSDLNIFSFHPVKTITTGEGGAITTNSKELNNKIKLLREHGIERNSNKFKFKSPGKWYYEQQLLGYNFRMSDMNAALGISQLNKIELILKKRNKNHEFIIKKLSNLPIIFQKQDSFSSCHLTIALVPKKIHRKLFAYLRKNKIWVNLHYIPLYKHPFFEMDNKKTKKKYLNSEKYYKMAISLPNYYLITKKEMSYFINLIQKFFLKNRI